MTTTVINSVGTTGRAYSTWQAWEDAAPVNMTTTRSSMTVAGSTSSTIMMDVLASAVNDFYNGLVVFCDARPSQKRRITAYDGTTKVATVGSVNGSNATWDNTPGTEAFTVDSVIYEGQGYNDSEFVVTAAILISGLTTDATRYMHMTTGSGQSFKDDAGKLTNPLKYDQAQGVGLYTATGYIDGIIRNNVNYTRFTGLQLINVVSGGPFLSCLNTQSGTDAIIDQCIVESGLTLSGTRGNLVAGARMRVINTALISNGGQCVYNDSRASTEFRNVTFAAKGNTGTQTAMSAAYTVTHPLFVNCAVFGFSSVRTGASSGIHASSNYNSTDLTAPTDWGANSLASQTFADQFESVTTDFRAKSDGNLDGSGTRDQTYTSDLDVVGQARSTTAPTIGAWEVVSAATFKARHYYDHIGHPS